MPAENRSKFLAFLVLFCLQSATEARLTQKNPKIAQFIVEQARWRHWASASFVDPRPDSSQEIFSYAKVLSKSWIRTQKAKEGERRWTFNNGRVYFFNNESRSLKVLSPSLILADKNDEDICKGELSANSSLQMDSNIILAYYGCSAGDQICNDIILDQIYRLNSSAPITSKSLGKWTFDAPTRIDPTPPELRKANKQSRIRVGIKNSTASVNIEFSDSDTPPSLTSLAERDEEIHLIVLLKCLFSAMNISYEFSDFPKLGWKNDEGMWTHLLGAISDGSVHIAADTVDLSTEGIRQHMELTNPIIRAKCGVYLVNPDGVRLRDVVMGTFSPSLQVSVVATGLLLWLAMLAITLLRYRSFQPHPRNERIYEPTEALLWAISVLCMQGSCWSPKSLSGCLLLIFSLMFALITYNSFAAFITSLLSVDDNPFRIVEDLLKTDIVFGYVKESGEEHLLRTVDEAALRALYYRGLVAGGGVDKVTDGMTRASKGGFALFASARLARRVLNSQVSTQWRCRMMELLVASTQTTAAIPLAINSPYNSLIHYWLIRVRETGILKRIQYQLLPPKPSCITGHKFHGASLNDLKTAFGALFLGVVLSCMALLIEILWAKRQQKQYNEQKAKAVQSHAQKRNSRIHYGLPPEYSLTWVN